MYMQGVSTEVVEPITPAVGHSPIPTNVGNRVICRLTTEPDAAIQGPSAGTLVDETNCPTGGTRSCLGTVHDSTQLAVLDNEV